MPVEERKRLLDSHLVPTENTNHHHQLTNLLSNPISSFSSIIPRKLLTFDSSQQQHNTNTSSIPIIHSHSNRRARSLEPGLELNPNKSTHQSIQTSSPSINTSSTLKHDHQIHHSSPLKKSLAQEVHPTAIMHPPPRPNTCESIHKNSDHSSPSKTTPGRTNSLTRISNHSSSFSNTLPPILVASEHLQSHIPSQKCDSSTSPPRNPITLGSSDSPSPVSFSSHSVPLDHSSPTPSAPTQVSSNPLSRIRTAVTPPPSFQSPVRTPLTSTSQSSVSKLLHSSNSFAFTTERGQIQTETNTLTSPNTQPSSLLRSPLNSTRPSPSKLLPSNSQATNTNRPTFSSLAISPLASSSQSDSNSVGINDKPTYSYAALIGQAINCSESKKVCLNDIYAYIMQHYSYYRKDEAGWQNSIRHNLSLNESFIKVPRGPNEPGKGSFWAIAPGAEDQFVNGGFKKKSSSISTPQQPNRDQSQKRHKVGGSSVTKRVKSNEEEPIKAGPSTLTATPTPTINITSINPNPISSARVPGMRTVSHANYSRSQQSSTSQSSSPHYTSSPNRSGYHHSPTEDLMTATMSRVKVGGIRYASTSAASSSPWNGSKEIYKRPELRPIELTKWSTRNRETSIPHRNSTTIHHPHHQPLPPLTAQLSLQSSSSSSPPSNPSRYPVSLSLGHKKRKAGEGEIGSSPSSFRSMTSIKDSSFYSKPILDETDETFGTPKQRSLSGIERSNRSNHKYSLPALPRFKRFTEIEMKSKPDESLRLAPIIGGQIDDQTLEKKKIMKSFSSIRLSSVNEILNSTKNPFKSKFNFNSNHLSCNGFETPVSSFRSTVLNLNNTEEDQREGEGEGEDDGREESEGLEEEEDEIEIDEIED